MANKSWYQLVTPREDLRENKPLDASEFAVHLDQIRDGRATPEYQNPEIFFGRTFLTKNLLDLSSEVVRRLSGERTETSAIFNMSTQFGGGKTHSLTLLYHLAKSGAKAGQWPGVGAIIQQSGVKEIPEASVAVFVGTEFDAIAGRGGDNGEPLRKTPWGEIAFQLGGAEAFEFVKEHDEKQIAPGGDVIRKFLPANKPCLILIDELMNYISRNRRVAPVDQFYSFLHNLSEEIRGRDNTVMVISLPASELEMTAQDEEDYGRLKKLINRLAKAVIMSVEDETSEIIRRRLFEWDEDSIGADGKIKLPREAVQICNQYAEWVNENRLQLPGWFSAENAREAFMKSYPFHPALLSAFERKWQSLPSFQRTRGVLRMLALWVADAYKRGYETNSKESLIGLGTAPLDNSFFRSAVFDQMGEQRLEVAVTTDICGKPDSHSITLDNNASEEIRKNNLHKKAATAIFFESNGGATRENASEPEVRLAIGEPGINIGNVETALEALSSSCYYLTQERKNYRFGMSPNLNKLLADRRANIQQHQIQERVEAEIRDVFRKGNRVERVFFPTKPGEIPDTPSLTLVVLSPGNSIKDDDTLAFIERMTKEYASTNRVFKSALLWSVPEDTSRLADEARRLLAWEAIEAEQNTLRIDDEQKKQLKINLEKSRRDLTEFVWFTYKNVVLLNKENNLNTVDLGLIHSSAADHIVHLIVNRLRTEGYITESIGPSFLVRHWNSVHSEWSTKNVRNAFFASPKFPRLLRGDSIIETIMQGVTGGHFAYVGKKGDGTYSPFYFDQNISPSDIEIAEDTFLISREQAEQHIKSLSGVEEPSDNGNNDKGFVLTGNDYGQTNTPPDARTSTSTQSSDSEVVDVEPEDSVAATSLNWEGKITPHKWMTFYSKVLAKLVSNGNLDITVKLSADNSEGISEHTLEEVKNGLRDLDLMDDLNTK